MGSVRYAVSTVDAEQVAVTGCGDLARLLVLVFEIDQHLHLDAARERVQPGATRRRREGVAPDEEPRVANRIGLRRDVLPLELADEVLVLLGRAQEADRLAGRDDLV